MSIARIVCTAFVMALFGGLFGTKSASAELMDCSASQKYKGQSSKEIIRPTPDRELVQWSFVVSLSSKNPEFDGIEVEIYEHDDQISGTGSHSGYGVYALTSGERLWTKFEGVHYTTKKGEYWESTAQGVFRFIAGTGKYKAIRGGGHYQTKSSPAGMTTNAVCSAVY